MKEAGIKDDPNLAILIPIVDALEELCDSLVFVGGCAAGLLITTARAQFIRPTKDVDVVVQATSLAKYYEAEKQLESKGFQHDISEGAPICRWVKNEILVDLMPSEEGILGFHNRWYPLAIETAERVKLPNGKQINLISAPVFIATKLEAFKGRGDKDFFASHDLEDIISVIDGRDELIEEIKNSNEELQVYVADEIRKLFDESDFEYSLPGHLPGDAASQERLPELAGKLRLLAKLE